MEHLRIDIVYPLLDKKLLGIRAILGTYSALTLFLQIRDLSFGLMIITMLNSQQKRMFRNYELAIINY